MAGQGGSSDLELADWNVALQEDSFDCSPVKQPLAQVALKDGNTQRVSVMGRPGGMAVTATGPKFVVAAPTIAPAQETVDCGAENQHAGAASMAADQLHSARRTHTPSRTGPTSRAVRLPSRLGVTPSGKQQQDHFVAPRSAHGGGGAAQAAAPATAAGGNLKSILKRLNFSTAKGRPAGASTAAAPAPASTAQPPGASAGTLHAQSTIKQLHFGAGTTPATAGTAAQLSRHRHVTFGAGTVSPGKRSRPDDPSSSGGAALAHRERTPQPAIPEEESSGDGEEPGGGSVNSNRAGHTPYDRRLSSLFLKYQEAGTPELDDAELDELVADGAVKSPSWNRLSSASVPESIRELSKRYDSQGGAGSMMGGPLGSPMPRPGAASGDAAMDDACTPVAAGNVGEESSPAMDPTPHNVVASVMQRNELYESPPVQGSGLTAQPAATTATAAATSAPASSASQPISPASALARLLAPVLVATIAEIQQDKAAAAGDLLSTQAQLASSPSLGLARCTPSASGPRSGNDGVLRDAEGIPAHTPTTVTVLRGSYTSGLRVLEQDDPLAANLFSTFSPSEDDGNGDSSGKAFCSPPQPSAAASPGPAPAGSPEFSFVPSAASRTQRAAAEAPLVAGFTPELPVLHGPGNTTISPEILGFYESQAQAAAAIAAGAGGASHATPGPAMPRSIIMSGRPLNEAGTPVLGHAQRGQAEVPPPTITRELQALMSGLRLEDVADLEQMGTVPALSPVRAAGSRTRGLLGGLGRAITPVRRSARKMAQAPPRPLEAMLEEADFSYVPNAALMPDTAQPKVEEAAAKAARKASSQAAASASQANGPSLSSTPSAALQQQPEVSSAAPGRRYSTRSAAKAARPGAHVGDERQDAEVEAAAAVTPGAVAQPGGDSRRWSLRRVHTPLQQAQHSWAGGQASTPRPDAVPAADTPVAQDASPSFAEGGGDPTYSLRSSTVKKQRKGGSRSGAGLTPATGGTAGTKEQRASPSAPPQLSPTEQGIRASLRRSARKSRGA